MNVPGQTAMSWLVAATLSVLLSFARSQRLTPDGCFYEYPAYGLACTAPFHRESPVRFEQCLALCQQQHKRCRSGAWNMEQMTCDLFLVAAPKPSRSSYQQLGQAQYLPPQPRAQPSYPQTQPQYTNNYPSQQQPTGFSYNDGGYPSRPSSGPSYGSGFPNQPVSNGFNGGGPSQFTPSQTWPQGPAPLYNSQQSGYGSGQYGGGGGPQQQFTPSPTNPQAPSPLQQYSGGQQGYNGRPQSSWPSNGLSPYGPAPQTWTGSNGNNNNYNRNNNYNSNTNSNYGSGVRQYGGGSGQQFTPSPTNSQAPAPLRPGQTYGGNTYGSPAGPSDPYGGPRQSPPNSLIMYPAVDAKYGRTYKQADQPVAQGNDNSQQSGSSSYQGSTSSSESSNGGNSGYQAGNSGSPNSSNGYQSGNGGNPSSSNYQGSNSGSSGSSRYQGANSGSNGGSPNGYAPYNSTPAPRPNSAKFAGNYPALGPVPQPAAYGSGSAGYGSGSGVSTIYSTETGTSVQFNGYQQQSSAANRYIGYHRSKRNAFRQRRLRDYGQGQPSNGGYQPKPTYPYGGGGGSPGQIFDEFTANCGTSHLVYIPQWTYFEPEPSCLPGGITPTRPPTNPYGGQGGPATNEPVTQSSTAVTTRLTTTTSTSTTTTTTTTQRTPDTTPTTTTSATTPSTTTKSNLVITPCPPKVLPDKALIGFAEFVRDVGTFEECYVACLEAQATLGFTCKSGMFFGAGEQNCILNTQDSTAQPDLFVDFTEEAVQYFEPCPGLPFRHLASRRDVFKNKQPRTQRFFRDFATVIRESHDEPVQHVQRLTSMSMAKVLSRSNEWGPWTKCRSLAHTYQQSRFRRCLSILPSSCERQQRQCTRFHRFQAQRSFI